MNERSQRRLLLTGTTGYVGGRLRRVLEERGRGVRCMARRPESLRGQVGAGTEIVRGDVLDPDSLGEALEGIHTAVYLVHSMGNDGDFEREDREGARNFGRAARAAGVKRIVYVGGLGAEREQLSAHLRSRHEVGDVLRESGVPVIELRASIVIGSGSLSFEMIRALVERLPVMITPRWVDVLAQPIAIDDLLDYLVEAIDLPLVGSHTFEIGGADQVSYGDLMREYARQRGLRRWMLRVPVLTPRLSSLWLGLVTPVHARIGRKLVESIRHTTVVEDERAREVFSVRPLGMREAISRTLRTEDREIAQTRWSDALSSAGATRGWAGQRHGKWLIDAREQRIAVDPRRAFAPVQRIGGENGWYAYDWLWTLRGRLDLLVGGVGVRRGRARAEELEVGETIDFWRVDAFEPDRRLRLVAEMKLPGRAWLEFEVEETDDGSILRQAAIFDPVGLLGLAYWCLVQPLHRLVFARMLRRIAEAAEGEAVVRRAA